MGFFQLYDADIFHSTRPSMITPTLSGAGGFFIDEGAGGILSGWFDNFRCTTCTPATSVPEPGTLSLAGAALLMMGYAVHRRRRVQRIADPMQ